MINKTKNYDMFKRREDNRAQINNHHVKSLVLSISTRNLLEWRPIDVNSKMEVIDGNHRLLAAKELGVDVWYEIKEDLQPEDVLLLNNVKVWTPSDYLNYFVKNDCEEYILFNNFIKSNNLPISIALQIALGRSKLRYGEFKRGKFKFEENLFGDHMETCKETIEILIKRLGYIYFVRSARFWNALSAIVRHENFNKEIWFNNVEMMVERFGPRATLADYKRLMCEVHNRRNSKKIDFMGLMEEGEIESKRMN